MRQQAEIDWLIAFTRWIVVGFLVYTAARLLLAPGGMTADTVPLRGSPILTVCLLALLPWQRWASNVKRAQFFLCSLAAALALVSLLTVYVSGLLPWSELVLLMPTFAPALVSLELEYAPQPAPWRFNRWQWLALAVWTLIWLALWLATRHGLAGAAFDEPWMARIVTDAWVATGVWLVLLRARRAGLSLALARSHALVALLLLTWLLAMFSTPFSPWNKAYSTYALARFTPWPFALVLPMFLLLGWRHRRKPWFPALGGGIVLLLLLQSAHSMSALSPAGLPLVALVFVLVSSPRAWWWPVLGWAASLVWMASGPGMDKQVLLVHGMIGTVAGLLTWMLLYSLRGSAPERLRQHAVSPQVRPLALLAGGAAAVFSGIITYALANERDLQTLQGATLLALLLGMLGYWAARFWLERDAIEREHQSLDRLSKVLSYTGVGYAIFRPDGSGVWANYAVLKPLGFSLEEFQACNVFIHGFCVSCGAADVTRFVLESGESSETEFQGEGPDGSAVDLRIRASRIELDGDHHALLQIDDMRTVHAQRDALAGSNTALQETLQQLELSLQSGQLGAFTVNLAEQALFADRRTFEIWGIAPPDRSVPMDLGKFEARVHREDLQKVRARMAGEADLECRMVGFDGTTRLVLIQRQVAEDLEGKQWLHGVTQDVTAVRQHEAQLRHAKDRMELQSIELKEKQHQLQQVSLFLQTERRRAETLRLQMSSLVNSQDSAVAMVDRDGRVQLCNRAFAGLLGLRVDDVVGRILAEVDRPEFVQAALPLEQAVLAGEAAFAEVTLPGQDGSPARHFKLALAPRYDDSGQVAGIIKSSTDITELVQARLDAQAGERAKQGFVNTVSHELRTPLNGLLGSLQLLAAEVSGERGRKYLQTCELSAQMLKALVNDVLVFATLDAGAIELDPQSVHLGDLLHRIHDLAQAISRQPGVKLRLTIDPGLDELVMVDDLRFSQVALNLLSNALKFTHKGEVHVHAQALDSTPQRLRFCLSVSDTGIGMDQDLLDRLFTPFTQADSSHARKYGGTGLGLTISMGLARAMGSQIQVHSVVGEGSTFSLELDLLREQFLREPQAQAVQEAKLLQGIGVLVVDDVQVNRDLLADFLQGSGANVVQAIHGQMALQLLEQSLLDGGHRIDLVLMDVQMPVMDGLEATRRLRENAKPALAAVPVVMVTGNANSSVVDQAARLGIDHVMVKPVVLAEVLQVVCTVLERKAQDKPGASAVSQGAPEARPAHQAPEGEQPLAGARVLVVDDQALNRLIAHRLLERLGATTVEAHDGEQALAMLEQQDPQVDLMLVDTHMPGLDGLALTRRLRASDNAFLRDLPVVGLSGDVDQASRRAALDAGMNQYLHKPVKLQDLSALRDLLA